MSPSFEEVLGGITSKSIAVLKATLAESWDSFTEDERNSCMSFLFLLARAHLYEIAGRDVMAELRVLDATLEQWKVVGKQVVIAGVQKAASEVLGLAGAFAGGLVATLIKGAL